MLYNMNIMGYNGIRASVCVSGKKIEFVLKRAAVRRLNMRVTAEGEVRVTVPCSTSDEEAAEFVARHARWVEKNVAEARVKGSFSFAKEGCVPVWGRRVPLAVRDGEKCFVREEEDGTLTVSVPGADARAADAEVSRWLLGKATEELPRIFGRAEAAHRGRFGAPVRLEVKVFESRWGVCNAQKRVVKLNALLITAPVECAEYVCLHELTHLICPGHGAEFYAVLTEICPDCRELKKKLEKTALTALPG